MLQKMLKLLHTMQKKLLKDATAATAGAVEQGAANVKEKRSNKHSTKKAPWVLFLYGLCLSIQLHWISSLELTIT